MALTVIVSTPAGAERRYTVERGQSCGIGRAADNMIVLDDQSVSSRHAAIELHGGVFRITDLRSRNGTSLNRRSLGHGGSSALKSGDEVRLGQCVLRVESDEMHTADTQNEDEPLSERVSPSSPAIPRMPPPVAAANAAVQALFGGSGEDSTALLPQSPEARDLSLRSYALRQSLNAFASAGPFDPKSQALPERLKEYIGLLSDESVFAGSVTELDAVLAASFPVAAAGGGDAEEAMRRMASDLAAFAMRAFAPSGCDSAYWRAWRDAELRAGGAEGREWECLYRRCCPALLQHGGFGDALRRQGIALMGAILVRLGCNGDARIREAIASGDGDRPASPGMLLDLQVRQMRGGGPMLEGEDEFAASGGLASAVRHWAATSTLCEHLFGQWNWLGRPDLSMPRRADEIGAVRDGGGALYAEWKDGLAPERVATARGVRHGALAFEAVPFAILAGAGTDAAGLLRAACGELARNDDARLHIVARQEGGKTEFLAGDSRTAPEHRMAIRAADGDAVAPRGLLFVVDARSSGGAAEKAVGDLRAFRDRHPALRHIPVGLVFANAGGAMGEGLRAMPRSHVVPDGVSLSVVHAGIPSRSLPENRFDRLRQCIVNDLAMNRHPSAQRFVGSLLGDFRGFFEELFEFTYRYQVFVAECPADGGECFGAAEPVRWMAAKLYGPFLRQARVAVLDEIGRIEMARGRMKSVGEQAERLRAAAAKRAEIEGRIARRMIPMPGTKGKLEAAAEEERLAERELRALLPVAEELAGIDGTAEVPWDGRLRRLEARFAELAAHAGNLAGQAEELNNLYTSFHPFGMTTMYWS